MISDAEKRRFLIDLHAALSDLDAANVSHGLIDPITALHRRNMLAAIADDYRDPDTSDSRIQDMRPWFEVQIAQGRTVTDMAAMLEAEIHRVVYALSVLGLSAPTRRAKRGLR